MYVAAAGLDFMAHFYNKDELSRRVTLEVAEQIHERNDIRDENLAVRIAKKLSGE